MILAQITPNLFTGHQGSGYHLGKIIVYKVHKESELHSCPKYQFLLRLLAHLKVIFHVFSNQVMIKIFVYGEANISSNSQAMRTYWTHRKQVRLKVAHSVCNN